MKPIFLLLFAVLLLSCTTPPEKKFIHPWPQNPRYWAYGDNPVLLLGASDNDNLFQSDNKIGQLDTLAAIGGNVIRNTMSSRDSGDVWPFYQQKDGLYDLDRWNDAYWNDFTELLSAAEERGIIVQIEVWDRFDFSRDPWQNNPFHPDNNINYTAEESGLAAEYPEHPYKDLQPFFHSIPGMLCYSPALDTVRAIQEKRVRKMLSISLNYGNVLYCMNNETNTPPEWGMYWIQFIRKQAESRGVTVYCTDMFDGIFRPQSSPELKHILNYTDIYSFLDISQINSRNLNQTHWDSLQWILEQREQSVIRPVNNTKVYGGPANRNIFGSVQDGVEKFCRDIMAGCASARFHRPPSGNGLSQPSKAAIRALRLVEEDIAFWNGMDQMQRLSDRETDEAYVTGLAGEWYVVYFPGGGQIELDCDKKAEFTVRWINVKTGTRAIGGRSTENSPLHLETPDDSGWFAVVK